MLKQFQHLNKKISYRIEGEGRPIVLVHGFAEDHRIWNNQIEHLRKTFQLILPDLPGYGESELTSDVSMEGLADLLHAIMDRESIDQSVIIGHSMGGYVTLAFAEKYPELLKAFGLFHSSAYPDSEEKKESRKKTIEFIKKNGSFEFLNTTYPNLFAKLNEDELENLPKKKELITKLSGMYKDLKADTLIANYEAMMNRPDRTNVLKAFTKPILIVAGEHDTAVPYQQVMEQTGLPLLPVVHVLHRSGHMGMLEEPQHANFMLEDFIKTNVL